MRKRLILQFPIPSAALLLALCLCLAWVPFALGGPQDPNSLVAQYQLARQAYSAQQFDESSKLFRSVASQCAGSELAMQCEYYGIMSDWALKPCEETAKSLSRWIDESQSFIKKAADAGRPLDNRFLNSWIENSQLLCAQWDRQQQRFDDAEKRLRSLLETRSHATGHEATQVHEAKIVPGATSGHPPKPGHDMVSASAWLELGSLLLHNKSNYTDAKACFAKSIVNCSHQIHDGNQDQARSLIQNQATFGSALASWHEKKWEEAKLTLSQLDSATLEENLAIQVRILRSRLANASQEIANIAIELEPAVQLALAGNPSAAVLYELAIALLEAGNSASSNDILVQIVHRFPQSPFSIEARVRLARVSIEQRDWANAIQLAEQAVSQGCPSELLPHARLALGQAQLESGRPQDALATLELISTEGPIDYEMQLSVRFHLAESLYQLERWPEAEKHWQWMLEIANQMEKHSKDRPAWLATILLRKAELLAFGKEWEQAEEIVLGIRSDFPECIHRSEVDYLLARCLVSRAQFEDARAALELVSNRLASTSSELLARANWMAGETYLMQRRYDEARVEYKKVLQVPGQKYWHSAALLQLGQCCEAIQDSESAREAYSQIVSQFSDSPFVSLARERLLLLPSSTIAKQTEQDSSGTKR
jgi:TolA-binding protein